MKIIFESDAEATRFFDGIVMPLCVGQHLASSPELRSKFYEGALQMNDHYAEHFAERIRLGGEVLKVKAGAAAVPAAPVTTKEATPEGGVPAATLSSLPLKPGTAKALRKALIVSLVELVRCTEQTLRVARGLSAASVEDVKFALAERGLKLAEAVQET